MFNVLKNNIIPYCGRKDLIKKNYNYYANNIKYVRKLFASVAMKEYSSLEIIDINILDNPNTIKEIKLILICMFKIASLKSIKYRWNTINADNNSFTKKYMGYSNTYRHQFNELFHNAYVNAVNKHGDDLCNLFPNSENAFRAALINMEQNFLGNNSNLLNLDLEQENKNAFRIALEDMYSLENQIYKYHIFDDNYSDEIKVSKDDEMTEADYNKKCREKRTDIFDDVFDFEKGINAIRKKDNKEIVDIFADIFIDCLSKQIKKDNMQKSSYLIKLYPEYYNALEKIKNEFNEKYSNGNSNMFNLLMKYYFNSSEC